MVEMVGPVLTRALQPFPVPVRTLDAIHLAALEFIWAQKQNVQLASYDERLLAAARKAASRPIAGQTCKQRAYFNRRLSGPMVLLAQDIASVRVRDIIRHEVWDILLKANGVRGSPPPPERPTRKRPELRIVRGDDQ
jgi:hypothetical protein